MGGEVCEIESSYLKHGVAEVYPGFLLIFGKISLYTRLLLNSHKRGLCFSFVSKSEVWHIVVVS